MEKVDRSVVNMANKVNVLRILWENKCIFRAEIARMTGLSQPTVLKIVDEFMERGLVNISGKGISSGGKPPLMLEFRWDAYYIIGVDINEYRIEIILMDLSFDIIDKRIQDNREVDTADTILKRLADEIKELIGEHPNEESRILGIGVGIPGIVDAQKGILIYSTELGWKNVNLKEYLKQYFDGQITIDDSTRAFAIEEKIFGKGKDIKNFLCLNLTSGIGSALVLDGNLYYGSSGSSGQLGHVAVEREGPLCSCGNYGCLEHYASGRAIEEAARRVVENHWESQIADLVYGDAGKVDLNIVFEAAMGGDRTALGILEKASDYLAMAVSGVVNLTDPEMIICEGKISRECPIFMEMFKTALRRRGMKYVGREVEIVVSNTENYMGSFGSASFILEQFIKSGGEAERFVRVRGNSNQRLDYVG